MQQETFSNKEHSLQIQESVNGKDVYIVQTGRGGPQVDDSQPFSTAMLALVLVVVVVVVEVTSPPLMWLPLTPPFISAAMTTTPGEADGVVFISGNPLLLKTSYDADDITCALNAVPLPDYC